MGARSIAGGRKAGSFTSRTTLAQVSGRTSEGRLIAQTRNDLTRHCGGNPSATQRHLIERAVWLTLHCSRLDAEMAKGGAPSDHASRVYLAWSNTLTRTLRALGLEQAPERPLSPLEALSLPHRAAA